MTTQSEILLLFVDERVKTLARARLVEGLKFFNHRSLRPGYNREEVKLALLLVQAANPKESFTDMELRLISALRQEKKREKSGK